MHKPGEVNNLYWQANSIDALGNATQFLLGNGMLTDQTFNPSTGRVQTIQAYKGSWYAQNHSYTFDALGNLTQRQDLRSGTLTQNFCYDGLNRLKASRFGSCSSSNTDFTYDALGNITSKLGMGNYSYGAGNAGPHAVTNAGGVNYTYDNNGRMLTGDGRTVSYTPFGKPKHMARGSNAVHIAYGPSQNRIERVDTGVKSATTTYVGGVYEKEISGGYTTHTHYLGDFALYIAKSSTSMNEERMVYLHRDHIGSVAAKTDMVATGNANAEFMANGPWGVRTQDKWNGSLLGDNFVPSDTARGFTNHEHLDGVGLVHMNGRVYEPSLGRFLSPDPWVQEPYNTQSYNRYSYLFNNALSSVDPSGEIGIAGGAVGAFAGGVAGFGFEAALQLGSGSFNGADLLASTAGGAAAGAIIGATGGGSLMLAGAGAAGAATSSAVNQVVGTGDGAIDQVAKDAVIGAIAGPLTGRVLKLTKLDQIAAGKTGKFKLSTLEKQITTKLNNGTLKINQLTAKTLAKLIALGIIAEVPAKGVFSSVDGVVDTITEGVSSAITGSVDTQSPFDSNIDSMLNLDSFSQRGVDLFNLDLSGVEVCMGPCSNFVPFTSVERMEPVD